jgi:hypothetical protein
MRNGKESIHLALPPPNIQVAEFIVRTIVLLEGEEATCPCSSIYDINVLYLMFFPRKRQFKQKLSNKEKMG